MAEPTLLLLPIDPRFPDQVRVHLGSTRLDPVIGDVAAPDPNEPGDTWSARESGDDAFWPGFTTQVRAARWLADRWSARRNGRPLPPPPSETSHG